MNELAFQSPVWALVALVVVVPLAALLVARHRSERVARVLALDPPGRKALVIPVLALVGIAVLVGTAAAQPVLVDAGEAPMRDDAELLVVVDVSRSMLASPAPGAPSRFERASSLARRVRGAVPEVPAGVVSLSDRALPHLFATHDARAFATTLDRALAVGRPLPRIGGGLATSIEPLVAVASRGYFTEGVTRRVALVLTDGEVLPLDAQMFRQDLAEAPPVDVVIVRLGGAGERVFRRSGRAESYRADPSAGAELEVLAAAIGGTVVPEAEPGRAEEVVRSALGVGAVHPSASAGARSRSRRSSWSAPSSRSPYSSGGGTVPRAVAVLLVSAMLVLAGGCGGGGDGGAEGGGAEAGAFAVLDRVALPTRRAGSPPARAPSGRRIRRPARCSGSTPPRARWPTPTRWRRRRPGSRRAAARYGSSTRSRRRSSAWTSGRASGSPASRSRTRPRSRSGSARSGSSRAWG